MQVSNSTSPAFISAGDHYNFKLLQGVLKIKNTIDEDDEDDD